MKKYLVILHTYEPWEEIEVTAKNKREAMKKARKIINTHALYMDYYVHDIITT